MYFCFECTYLKTKNFEGMFVCLSFFRRINVFNFSKTLQQLILKDVCYLVVSQIEDFVQGVVFYLGLFFLLLLHLI